MAGTTTAVVLRHKSGPDDFDFAGPDPDKPRRISAKYQLTRRLRRKLSDPGISPTNKASNAKRAALVTYNSTTNSSSLYFLQNFANFSSSAMSLSTKSQRKSSARAF